MNDIMLKALYREAYNFLARVDDNDLEAKLICPITTRAKSLKDLYRRLLNALITKKINEAIGGVDCLCEPFFDFNPVKVQARYGENHDQLSGKICIEWQCGDNKAVLRQRIMGGGSVIEHWFGPHLSRICGEIFKQSNVLCRAAFAFAGGGQGIDLSHGL